jgi:hypothetical protein
MLEENLRVEMQVNEDRFNKAVDAITGRYCNVAGNEIALPKTQAERLVEVAASKRAIASQIKTSALEHINTITVMLDEAKL